MPLTIRTGNKGVLSRPLLADVRDLAPLSEVVTVPDGDGVLVTFPQMDASDPDLVLALADRLGALPEILRPLPSPTAQQPDLETLFVQAFTGTPAAVARASKLLSRLAVRLAATEKDAQP